MRLRWTAPALHDLEAIGDFIAADNPTAADMTIGRILDRAELLTVHTELGRAGRVPGTRELVVPGTPFVVPYRVSGETVEVLAVLHGARRWPDRFD
ncbi:MAG: type II toxin-antitoxin system RelE/ParE family toxin [Rhodoplanes sp.]|uniref:type II toxin-antitoxin system RelE/ParE family toxin n=1 Tax=Rhodoplanes sp. TaxID=1968906 RepID=UPI00180EAC98|nr:type II toxin-antitoxin system RelE/ParE family toxin [Rhodoplanes sp.]NVO16902.1 type II toxin-antitoxin system RelE/ParE family toxin [Rhodoplanes sp.]